MADVRAARRPRPRLGRGSSSSRSTSGSRRRATMTATSPTCSRACRPPAHARVRPMPVDDPGPRGGAPPATPSSSRPTLDLVHLGLGPDGHTASLVPGDPVLEVDGPPRRAHRRVPGPSPDDAHLSGDRGRALGALAGHRRRQARRRWRSCAPATRRSRRAAFGRATPPCSPAPRRPALERACARPASPRPTSTSATRAGGKRPWSTTPGSGRQARREQDRIADLAAVVGDQAAVGGRAGVRRATRRRRARAASRRARSGAARAGSGRRAPSTGFDESAITTNRSAAAATIFSRVCAPPPPLTSQPSGAIWSAPSIAMSRRSSRSNGSTGMPS